MNSSDIVDYFENTHGVDVLYMSDIGSRAWSLDSPTSDKDAFLIFTQPPINWVKTGAGYAKDVFSLSEEGWDIQAWSLKKFGSLLSSSNPTAIEGIMSPIVYYTKGKAIEAHLGDLRQHAIENFNPIGLYYHYMGLAKNNYFKYLVDTVTDGKYRYNIISDVGPLYTVEMPTGEGVSIPKDAVEKTTVDKTVKRNVFVARAVCNAMYIRETHEFPSLDFEQMLAENWQRIGLSADEVSEINRLIKLKRGGSNEEVGNCVKSIIEEEIANEPKDDELNRCGIDDRVINEFVEQCHR